MTIYDFVETLRDSYPFDPDFLMDEETAAGDLENFRADGWDLPDGITPRLYADAWNSQVQVEDEDGKPVCYMAAVALMDDEIREALHSEHAGKVTPQEFYDLYCEAHREKHNEDFTV